MNWAAKDMNEIALNQIWSEHVRFLARPRSAAPSAHRFAQLTGCCCSCPPQCEKEKNFITNKTKYTCNPCASIPMNNGLGSRGTRTAAATDLNTLPPLPLPQLTTLPYSLSACAQCRT